jgi:CBS domain-containing protein
MSKELITITEDLSPREAFDYLNDNRTKLAPVIAKDGKLLDFKEAKLQLGAGQNPQQ